MNTEILRFIKEMRHATGKSFAYTVQAWEFAAANTSEVKHMIYSDVPGFKQIVKDTDLEIIASFGLMRQLANQLIAAQETSKKIEAKLISGYPHD